MRSPKLATSTQNMNETSREARAGHACEATDLPELWYGLMLPVRDV